MEHKIRLPFIDYYLGQNFHDIPDGLNQIQKDAFFNKNVPDEKFYRGKVINFVGREWQTTIAIIKDKIYRIGLLNVITFRDEMENIFLSIMNLFINEYGKYSLVNNDSIDRKIYSWNIDGVFIFLIKFETDKVNAIHINYTSFDVIHESINYRIIIRTAGEYLVLLLSIFCPFLILGCLCFGGLMAFGMTLGLLGMYLRTLHLSRDAYIFWGIVSFILSIGVGIIGQAIWGIFIGQIVRFFNCLWHASINLVNKFRKYPPL